MNQGLNMHLLVQTIHAMSKDSKLDGEMMIYQSNDLGKDPEYLIEWRFEGRLVSTKYNVVQLDDESQDEIYERALRFINRCKEIYERERPDVAAGEVFS